MTDHLGLYDRPPCVCESAVGLKARVAAAVTNEPVPLCEVHDAAKIAAREADRVKALEEAGAAHRDAVTVAALDRISRQHTPAESIPIGDDDALTASLRSVLGVADLTSPSGWDGPLDAA